MIRLEINAPCEFITSNQRIHRMEKARRTESRKKGEHEMTTRAGGTAGRNRKMSKHEFGWAVEGYVTIEADTPEEARAILTDELRDLSPNAEQSEIIGWEIDAL